MIPVLLKPVYDAGLMRVSMPRILVIGECSRIICSAFELLGCVTVSIDLKKSEIDPNPAKGHHWQMNFRNITPAAVVGFDLAIAHPPCTFLTTARNGHASSRWETERAIEDAVHCRSLVKGATCGVIENPVGILSRAGLFGPSTQIVSPHQFGSTQQKRTALWMYGPLARLKSTSPVGRGTAVTSTYNNATDRSRTDPFLAKAFATQWIEDLQLLAFGRAAVERGFHDQHA